MGNSIRLWTAVAAAASALLISMPAPAGPLRDRQTEQVEARRAADELDADDGPSLHRHSLQPGVHLERDLAYGPDAAQRLDVYRPQRAQAAQIVFMVHGGGWRRGDKTNARVVKNKVAHWVSKGAIVVSVNYRMSPQVDPVEQAHDVARALAFAQVHAASWGGDVDRFVVMGHSAGAHLVSLLTADTAIAARHGVRPWLGTVSLDSAAFDVVDIMQGRHFRLYDRVFKTDRALWEAASPLRRLSTSPMPPLLAVCSARRSDSCPQATAYAAKATSLGARATVLPVDLSHRDVNEQLGVPGAYTDAVQVFIDSLRPR
jgi:acetyl esterase/lipase